MAQLGLDCLLLCGEDNSSVFDDSDFRGGTLSQQTRSPRRRPRDRPDVEPMFPVLSDECLGELVEKERQHLPKCDYLMRLRNGDLDPGARKEAIDWMFKVVDSRFVFEARTIQRMELLVLSTLHWRMQAVSPFAFIDHFLRRISGNNVPTTALMSRSVQVILSTLRGIELLEFRPSEVAAAVAVCITAEAQSVQTEQAISTLTQHVEKGRVRRCLELMYELPLMSESAKIGTYSAHSVPQSPIGVLEAACFSCNSSQNNTPENNKRRKISTPFHEV